MTTHPPPAGYRLVGDSVLISSTPGNDAADPSVSSDLPTGFAHSNLPPGAVPLERGIPAWRQLWKRSSTIVVYDATGFRIVTIPLDFLEANSLDRDWSHISNVLGCCMETAMGSLHSLRREATLPVVLSSPPLSGNYVFIRQGKPSLLIAATSYMVLMAFLPLYFAIGYSGANPVQCAPAVGPHGKHLGRQPRTDDQSSASASSRTSRGGQVSSTLLSFTLSSCRPGDPYTVF